MSARILDVKKPKLSASETEREAHLKAIGLPWPLLSMGSTGIVMLDDETTARKFVGSTEASSESRELQDLAEERRIYERLGSHPRICKYISSSEREIVLERHTECLGKRLLRLTELAGVPSRDIAFRWSIQAAEGLAYIHSKGVLQGDISIGNILLDKQDNLVFCDFGGSSIDGSEASVLCGTRFQRPHSSSDPALSVKDEIFALGSLIYTIWTTHQPYHEEDERTVERYYEKLQFPAVHHLHVGHIIAKCWNGAYLTALEVLGELQQLESVDRERIAEQSLHQNHLLYPLPKHFLVWVARTDGKLRSQYNSW